MNRLQEQLGYESTHTYNCIVSGNDDLPAHTIEGSAAMERRLIAEHALYFVVGCTHPQILDILSTYSSFKLEHESATACFILPKRTSQWNARVLHMQCLGMYRPNATA